MKILIFDVETTNLIDKQIIEVAACLYRVDNYARGVICSASCLFTQKKNDAENINKISPELTRSSTKILQENFKNMVYAMLGEANYCTSFNIEFDRPLVQSMFNEVPEAIAKEFPEATLFPDWFCSYKDIDWDLMPKNTFRLIDLALELGIGVTEVHRAASDVNLLVQCFNRVPNIGEKIAEAIANSTQPTVLIHANVSYANKQLAKEAGFQWDSNNKKWSKNLKKDKYEEMRKIWDFETTVVEV